MAVRNIINVCVLLVLIIHLILVDLFSFLGSILAMSGKDCVAVAVDKRFGSGPQVRFQEGMNTSKRDILFMFV